MYSSLAPELLMAQKNMDILFKILIINDMNEAAVFLRVDKP